MVKTVRVLTNAEFSVLRKYVCVRCEHFGYCPSCKKLECSFGLPLSEAPCKHFVRNVARAQARSILAATFLGCLVGGVINTAVIVVAGLELYFGQFYYSMSPWLMLQAMSGWFVTETFSRALFASFAAILFAYYYKHPDRTSQ